MEPATKQLLTWETRPPPSTDPESVEAETKQLRTWENAAGLHRPRVGGASDFTAMRPLYTPANCKAAYQLRWSLALFNKVDLPPTQTWSDALGKVVERDGVRLLESHLRQPRVSFFLLSTQPPVSPPQIVKSVKGRFQHLLRTAAPKAFRRNFSLTSVGEVNRDVVESYVSSQLGHHGMADPRVQARFREFQFSFPTVNLATEQFSSHGRYVYNLHLVLVHEARWREVREDRLAITRDMFFRVARQRATESHAWRCFPIICMRRLVADSSNPLKTLHWAI